MLVCTSEAKALLPFLPAIETDLDALRDYFAFQFTLARQDAVQGRARAAARALLIADRLGRPDEALVGDPLRARHRRRRGAPARGRSASCSRTRSSYHLRADVPVGGYLSGGLDSSIVTRAREPRQDSRVPRVHRPLRRRPAASTSPATHARSPSRRASSSTSRRSARTTSSTPSATSSTTSTTRSPARARSRSTSSRARPPRAPQGRARRPGRGRGLRRLRALSGRLLRAVHQGGDRGDDAQRPVRRHVRVDHPAARRASSRTGR